MSSLSYDRPPFWNKLPHNRKKDSLLKTPPPHTWESPRRKSKKRVHFVDEVQLGSPAYGEVLRGDVISKIGEYDARDLRHSDAQMLFRTAGNDIRIVVHRESKIAYTQGLSTESSRCSSAVPPVSPVSAGNLPHRGPSPFLPGPGQYDRAMHSPLNTLPHTVFPNLNESGGYVAPYRPDSQASQSFSPMPTRDHQQDVKEEQAAIVNQVFATELNVTPWERKIGIVTPASAEKSSAKNRCLQYASVASSSISVLGPDHYRR